MLKKASNQGLTAAQHCIALMYLQGIYVNPDLKQAFEYLSKAQEHGNLDSQLILGVMLIKGYEVEKNLKKGISYLQICSNAGFGQASLFLASVYATEPEVLDLKKSKEYAMLAKQQDPELNENIDELIDRLSSLRSRIKTYISVKFKNRTLDCLSVLFGTYLIYLMLGITGAISYFVVSIISLRYKKNIR